VTVLDLVLVGTLSAFGGTFVATHYLNKLTIGALRYGVALRMLVIGAALSLDLAG
jgi:hypothetical protein